MATRPLPGEQKVPLLDLRAQYLSIRDEIASAIDRVVSSQVFIGGPEVEALEQEIASYCGSASAVGVSSGTDALLVSLMALGVGPGDEVITTPFTFVASVSTIVRTGATPVLADIDDTTFTIDPRAAAAAVTGRTKAIVPVHLYGRLCDMPAITALGLPVVEDAAQAIGATAGALRAGSIGAAGCLSFFPSKNLGGFGDGGMVTTSDPELDERMRMLRNHGFHPKYTARILGGNFRLDALQAAVLRVKLRHLDRWTQQRRDNAARYRELFAGIGAPPDLLRLPADIPGHVYNQFVIRTPRRAGVMERLTAAGIGHEIYYPVPMHLQPCFAGLGYREGDFPASEAAARESLALPIYPELSEGSARAVVAAVAEAISRSTPPR